MHETYLLPFAEAVREGSASIMCSYNKINGTAVCQNSAVIDLVKNVRTSRPESKQHFTHLVTADLQELNFPGFIISDWGK
jgi:beta-glucosidase